MSNRPLYVIAKDIRASWPKMSPYARPYVDAMARLNGMGDVYIADDARSVVLRFLCNAGTWRGEDARRIKVELKGMCDQ